MHFHHYTLRHLATYLQQEMVGQVVTGCWSQNRNELVLALGDTCWRIGCHTPLTYVAPAPEYTRARRNVADLFPALLGQALQAARVVAYERELILVFGQGCDLVLKLHGISANVLLRQDGVVVGLFNQQHSDDLDYTERPGHLGELPPDDTVTPDARAVREALRALSPIYDKFFAARILAQMVQGAAFSQALAAVVAEAASGTFYLLREADRIRLLLFPPPDEMPCVRVAGVLPALQAFLRLHYQYETYRSQYREAGQEARKPFEKYRKVLDAYGENIRQLEADRNPEELGHILMAFLHQIEPGSALAELPDLYGEGVVAIKLDPRLGPADNATRYYEKHKQRKARLLYLYDQLEDIEAKLAAAEADMQRFMALPAPGALVFDETGFDPVQLRAMRDFARRVQREVQEVESARSPFRTFKCEGFDIFVGKNARNSDELSFKFAHREDLWLHVKDVPGSHVIIRQRAGRDIPPTVLEYAAQLAAYYSKRKNDSLVPVQYTPRKYIRKRKGDPPGLVAVDREQVIMVEPLRS
ncbi:MAG: NFACT family protein [Bacteroidia bacterium]